MKTMIRDILPADVTTCAQDTAVQKFYEKADFYVSPKMILMARRFSS